jgi:hypothetical protein
MESSAARGEDGQGAAGRPGTADPDDAGARRFPIASLLPADSPRIDDEDAEHIRLLADSGATLPPILVHRPTMRVIDGMRRLGAAVLRGDDSIEVRFFDGPEDEAFILAVQANIAHGRPLSLGDRTSAAERIIRTHGAWSDRAIATAAGLGARTVCEIRRHVEADGGAAAVNRARIGRDGRVRPLDGAEGRLRASEFLKNQPDASVREIARTAGVSPTTALDVRNRLRRGGNPVPSVRGTREPAGARGAEGEPDLTTMLQGLRRDPSLRFNESGRGLLRWIDSRAIRPGEWRDMTPRVPTDYTCLMADVARACADQWRRVAEDLERRSQHVA